MHLAVLGLDRVGIGPEWKPMFQKLVAEEHLGMGTPTLVETGILLAGRPLLCKGNDFARTDLDCVSL